MDYKFWNDVYKTAKPWVLGVIIICIIIGVYLNQENTKHFLNSGMSKKIILHLTNSFLILLGLNLWDSKKFPFNYKRIFSLFLISLGFSNILQ